MVVAIGGVGRWWVAAVFDEEAVMFGDWLRRRLVGWRCWQVAAVG